MTYRYRSSRRSFVKAATAAAAGVLTYNWDILNVGAANEVIVGALYVGPKTDYGWNQAHAEGVATLKKAGVKVQSGDVMMIRTGRWARRDAQGPWAVQQLAGLHMSCAPWMHARDVAILGGDDAQDVLPSRVEGVSQPIHALCIVAMGMPIFDNLDLELIGREAEKRKRWEFLVTASPAAVPGATGSVLNPIATF